MALPRNIRLPPRYLLHLVYYYFYSDSHIRVLSYVHTLTQRSIVRLEGLVIGRDTLQLNREDLT